MPPKTRHIDFSSIPGTLEEKRRTANNSLCGVSVIAGWGSGKTGGGERNGVLSPPRRHLAEPDLPVDVHIVHEVRRFSLEGLDLDAVAGLQFRKGHVLIGLVPVFELKFTAIIHAEGDRLAVPVLHNESLLGGIDAFHSATDTHLVVGTGKSRDGKSGKNGNRKGGAQRTFEHGSPPFASHARERRHRKP